MRARFYGGASGSNGMTIMAIMSKEGYEEAGRNLGKGFLKDQFEDSGLALEPALALGEFHDQPLEVTRHNLALDGNTNLQPTISSNAQIKTAEEKEKEEKKKWGDFQFQLALQQELRKLDEQIAHWNDIAKYWREREAEQLRIAGQALDDGEIYRKRYEDIQKILDEKTLNRERAKEILKAAGIETPDNATDTTLRLLLKQAQDEALKGQKEAAEKHNDAQNKAHEYNMNAQEAEKFANDLLKKRNSVLKSAKPDDEKTKDLAALHEENKVKMEEALKKLENDKLVEELKGFSREQQRTATPSPVPNQSAATVPPPF